MVQSKALLELEQSEATWAGSKAVRLRRLAQGGFAVPAGLAIGADAYQRFVEETAVLTSIWLMISRKRFEDSHLRVERTMLQSLDIRLLDTYVPGQESR